MSHVAVTFFILLHYIITSQNDVIKMHHYVVLYTHLLGQIAFIVIMVGM